MDPMWTIEWKGIKENLDIKDLLDQEIEVWSLLDGDEPPVLQPMIRNYATKAARSNHLYNGGGTNYIFYLVSISQRQPYIYGAGYRTNWEDKGALAPLNDHNVPCVVCYVSTRVSYLMIPAKITCPKTWTTECQGYLMAERFHNKCNAVYECVDKDAESIPGSIANINGALFYHVQAQCNGLLFPLYDNERVILCGIYQVNKTILQINLWHWFAFKWFCTLYFVIQYFENRNLNLLVKAVRYNTF